MAKKLGPYVGVVGFMSPNEVAEALTVVPNDTVRRLMVGILADSGTLTGSPNVLPNRYPKKEEIAGIFSADPRTLNLIHYRTPYPKTLSEQLAKLVVFGGPNLDGFQLNIPWPPIEELEKFREKYPELVLVLEIGLQAMNEADSVPKLKRKVKSYLPFIDSVLFSQHPHHEEPLDARSSFSTLLLLKQFEKLGLGVVGCLGFDSLHLVSPLVSRFSNLSIEAEWGLRSGMPKDKLLLWAVKVYVEEALQILAGKQLPGIRMTQRDAPYGFEGHVRYYGTGRNMLRTPRIVQPCALQPGDVLATGEPVLSLPREGGNGTVYIHLSNGRDRDGVWIGVPARIPLALLTDEDGAPEAVRTLHEK
ncbi:MAG: hypothetical protein WCT08_03855 [Patescibacteria group bacterium]|jgi:hypothetical protein